MGKMGDSQDSNIPPIPKQYGNPEGISVEKRGNGGKVRCCSKVQRKVRSRLQDFSRAITYLIVGLFMLLVILINVTSPLVKYSSKTITKEMEVMSVAKTVKDKGETSASPPTEASIPIPSKKTGLSLSPWGPASGKYKYVSFTDDDSLSPPKKWAPLKDDDVGKGKAIRGNRRKKLKISIKLSKKSPFETNNRGNVLNEGRGSGQRFEKEVDNQKVEQGRHLSPFSSQ